MVAVTVAVPSLNQGQYLERALASLAAQPPDVEVFLMDGGSTDDTAAVIKRWSQSLAGVRSGPDGGQAQAVNEGISLGSAPYVCWLNSDDWLLPHGLETLLNSLEQNPSAPAAYGRAFNHFEGSSSCKSVSVEPFDQSRLALRCIISQPATLIRRSVWETLGGLDESLHMAMDYDLWWRVYKHYGPLLFVDAPIAVNSVHPATKTNRFRRRHYREAIRVVKKHHGKVPLKWILYQPYAVWWKGMYSRLISA